MTLPGGAPAIGSEETATVFMARIDPLGPTFAVARGQSLLEAAAAAGIDWPNSCRNGTCRTCICRLLDGRISYSIEWPGVLPEEKAEGWILPCVARAESDLVLGWPATRQTLPGV